MKIKPLIVFLLLSVNLLKSQLTPQFHHFSVDDGLSENNILCMLQDKKGILWFGTYDGLNSYDGYNFNHYKGSEHHKFKLSNYRIDNIQEDLNGFLWIQTYDGRHYRFNTSKFEFIPIPEIVASYSKKANIYREKYISKDSSVWLYANDQSVSSILRVSADSTNTNFRLTDFQLTSPINETVKVNSIVKGTGGISWILTNLGIYYVINSESRIKTFQNPALRNEFFSFCEQDKYCFFGGKNGLFIKYNAKNLTFSRVKISTQFDVIKLCNIGKNHVLLITNSKQFFVYDTYENTIEKHELSNKVPGVIYDIQRDDSGKIWFATNFNGAVYFDPLAKKIHYLQKSPNAEISGILTPKLSVLNDKNGNTWISTSPGGFYLFNKAKNSLEPFFNNPLSKERKFSNLLHAAISDNQGNVWISTYSQGVDKVSFNKSDFQFVRPVSSDVYTNANEIRALYKDLQGMLWVGSRRGYVYVFDEENKLKGRLTNAGSIGNGNLFEAPVYNITEDKKGNIWLSTKGKGLYKLSRRGGNKFEISNYRHSDSDKYSISSDAVYNVHVDKQNNIWVATFGGGVNLLNDNNDAPVFINKNNQLRNYPKFLCNRARYITSDNNGNYYVGTTDGLLMFRWENQPEKVKFSRYYFNPEKKVTLSGNDVQYILPTRNGDVYLALFGGGVNVLKQVSKNANKLPEISKLCKKDGTISNVIYTLLEDKSGNVWMSTQTKLIRYNINDSTFSNYKPENRNRYFFVEGSAAFSAKGEILFGTSDGVVLFSPERLNLKTDTLSIRLRQLYLFNKPAIVGAKKSPLIKSLDDTKELILNHQQTIFSIEFSAIEYRNPQNVQYAYKLEGFESDWNYVGNQHMATYTNLPKGEYLFRVKSTNERGEWLSNERVIRIVRLPSFWESTLGLLFYFVLFLLVLIMVNYLVMKFYNLRNEIFLERQIANFKTRIFTDLSHELRTPLTLIASPVENLLKTESFTDNIADQLQIVHKNAQRMIRLVNQILDFRKIQKNKMNLLVEKINIATEVCSIIENFKRLAFEKDVLINLHDTTNNEKLWVDKDKFETILYNLISNAFKFSKPGKQIDIHINDTDENVIITIKDEGCGISHDRIKQIFNRFESFVHSGSSMQASTGIGLSLAKELVEFHDGSITVQSDSMNGTIFSITFKKGFEHLINKCEFLVSDFDSDEKILVQYLNDTNNIQNNGDRLKVLIVEDNDELRFFLKKVLSHHYDIIEASNGEEAFGISLQYLPDVIVTDLMMPETDGLALLQKIKTEISISHTPVIVISAKTDTESKLELLQAGADDYIVKPFSTSYLVGRIDNIMATRAQLHKLYQSSLSKGVYTLSKPDFTPKDEYFIQKTLSFIELNISNSKLTVDDIAESIGISRSSFFKKMKSVTGLAPNDFIRELRIERALQIMEAGETNISQVSFMIGIEDPRYFSKCFKQKFGVTPRDYIKQKL